MGNDYDRGHRGYRTHGGNLALEIVSGKTYSANQICASQHRPRSPHPPPRKSSSSSSGSGSGSGGSGSSWWLNEPEMKRRGRVASYKAYSVEGKVKASLRRGFRWLKTRCSTVVHGW